MSEPNALCFGARRSLCWAPTLCRGPASVSGRGALFGAQRSLCRVPALCVWGRPGSPLPTLSVSGPTFFLPGSGALCVEVYVGARRSSPKRPWRWSDPRIRLCGPLRSACQCVALIRFRWPQPRSACHPSSFAGPQLRSACHPSGRGRPAQIRVPPIQPGAFPLSMREPQTFFDSRMT